MRKVLLVSLIYSSAAMAALSVTGVNSTPTQALMFISGFTGDCTIKLSESPSLTPLHPDTDGSKYAGADTDTGRPDTFTQSSGTIRVVTVGHRTSDRALATETTYYYQVSGCGGTASGSFTTPTLSQGTTRTDYFGFDSSKWGNLDIPAFDWTKIKNYTDPHTGAKLIPMLLHTGTWRTGGGGSGAQSGYESFVDWAGGAGWTNPAGILNGSTSTASTSNTNPLDLFGDLASLGVPINPYDPNRILEDIAAVVWAGASGDSAAGDRQFHLDLMVHGTSCGEVTAQAAHGSITAVPSGSSDPDGAWPSGFPSAPYKSWSGSTSPCLHQEDMETSGSLTVSGSALTIASPSSQNSFSSALVAGDKIWIQGSSCPNHLCTIASVTNPAHATVSETPGDGTANYRAYGWWIRIAKLNATGTLRVGLKYKLAGSSNPTGGDTESDTCNINSFTSGDGKTGHLCQLTARNNFVGYLAFVADDGTVRLLTGGYGVPIGFDDRENASFFQSQTNSSNSYTIQKIRYIGNATENIDYGYSCSAVGGCASSLWDGNVCDYPTRFTCSDLMPHAAGADLQQQITAKQGTTLPAYNFSLYGDWTTPGTPGRGSIGYYKTSGHFAVWCNVYSGQGQWPSGGGPGWCAVVDLSTAPYATVSNLIHTLDGTGIPNFRFGSLHTAQPLMSRPNTIFFGLDPVQTGSTSVLHGGPFQAQVKQVLLSDGATWSSNTCLPGIDGSGACSQVLYTACPSNWVALFGANGCITVRLPQGGVCNVSPSAAEYSTFAHCPWSPSNATQYPVMQAGDLGGDLHTAGPNGQGTQSEQFKVLSTTADGSYLKVVLARNAVYYYCSFYSTSFPWHGHSDWPNYSAQQNYQTQHNNGWTFTMSPGTTQSCGVGNMFWDATVRGAAKEIAFGDHWATGANSNGLNFITATETIYNSTWANLDQIPPVFTSLDDYFHDPASRCSGSAYCQSYPNASQFAQGPSGYRFAFDTNADLAWSSRTVTPVAGAPNVYTIQPSTPSGLISVTGTSYKIWGINGTAGRYQLKDVSGPVTCGAPCQVDSQPFSMCFANAAGECHSGSAANQVYVNVPEAFDRAPNLCETSQNWYNNPCVYMGVAGPANSVRQFRIAVNDSNGSYSRAISYGMSSQGRDNPYTHTSVLPAGNWLMQMGTHTQDGFDLVPWLIKVPSWDESSTTGADFMQVPVAVGSGTKYAEIRFGYANYGAVPASFQCSPRAEGCNTRRDVSTVPYNYLSESRSLTSCASGCTINVPAIGPNLLYYQVWRSSDGSAWNASGDIQAVVVGAQRSGLCAGLTFSPASHSSPAAGDNGTITVTDAGGACAWTASSNAGWLSITSGGSGTGSGTISWKAAANSGSARSAAISAAGAVFTENQAGAGSAANRYNGRISGVQLQ